MNAFEAGIRDALEKCAASGARKLEWFPAGIESAHLPGSTAIGWARKRLKQHVRNKRKGWDDGYRML